MNIFRCNSCGKLLFKFRIYGTLELEIKCPRCGAMTTVRITK